MLQKTVTLKSAGTNRTIMSRKDKEENILNSHSDLTELPDGTKLRVTVENYKEPLFPHGPQIIAACKVDYVNMRGTRWVGNYFESHYTDEDMLREAAHIVAKIKENPSNYKFEYAPK